MALKALMLRKRLNDAKNALEELRSQNESFVTREAELEASISEVNTDEERDAVSAAIDEFEAERKDHEEKKADLERQVADLEAELQEEEKEHEPAEDPVPEDKPEEERKEIKTMDVRSTKEYLHAYAEMIRNSLRNNTPYDETKCRELLTRDDEPTETPLLTENVSGSVPVPTYVEDRIQTAWAKNGIMDLVTKTYIKGNVKIGFEYSATGATKHTEGGAAITEEELVLGAVSLVASNYKKFLRVSDEALDLRDEAFLDYLYDEIAYQIAKAVSDDLIAKIKALNTSGSTSAVPCVEVSAAPGLATLGLAVAALSEEATDVTAIMNKLTMADFITAQAQGNFAFDPFSYVNRTIFSSALDSYTAADAGETYIEVCDLSKVQANFPAGADIKFVVDPYTDAERDLVKIVGRQFVAIAPVGPKAFCNVKKPTTSA